jgi:acyl-CoA synthetase (AMP-forming)/AMP-acid ligase II
MKKHFQNNALYSDPLSYSTVSAFLISRCKTGGDSVFLKEVSTNQSVTYDEFWNLVCQVSNWFEINAIETGDTICLALENDIQSVALFFASLCKSIIPAVVNKNISKQELNYIIELINPKKIVNFSIDLVDKRFVSFDFSMIKIFYIKNVEHRSAGNANDIAYITFTSGSTGVPRGVCISNRNVLSEISSFIQAYCLEKSDVHLCVLPVSHASALYRNLFLPFSLGSKVVMTSKFDVKEFWQIIEDKEVTFVQVVPSILSSLLVSDTTPGKSTKERLRFIGSASAPHPESLIRKFEERFGISILQGYGMTEATCGITLSPIERELRISGSVGRPIPGNRVEIWDEDGRCLPPHEIGEVVVQGKNIMMGYVDQNLNSNIKLRDGRLCTGDLGYLDENNNLFLIGRKNDIIKRAGHRVSPKEIENALYFLEEIRDAKVLGIPHDFLGEDIIAFVTLNDSYSISGRKIISKLKGQISSHKLPSEICVLTDIPRNSVGKIDSHFLFDWYEKYCAKKRF